MKIDLVYLWCDGNDPKFIAAKNELKENLSEQKIGVDVEASTDSRFRCNDELKYSLRSAQKFVPWINHIYIVTNGQVPSWLDVNNPKISIITHNQIMPHDALPTFNSNAIEACIDNIAGLSEFFLYANDDFFFGKPLTPDNFFIEGRPQNYIRMIKKQKAGLYQKQIANAKQLLYIRHAQRFNINVAQSHNIEPLRVSYIKELKEIFPVEFEDTIHSQFRKENNVQWLIYVLYNYIKGGDLYRHKGYFDGKKTIRRKYNEKLIDLAAHIFDKKVELSMLVDTASRLEKLVKNLGKVEFFCINDSDFTDEELTLNKEFLEKFLPEKSVYEL